MRYESDGDVKTRLHNTVVVSEGRPCLVISVENRHEVIVQDLENGNHTRVKVVDLDLDPSHAPLGYVINDGEVMLAMRKPTRRYKQGLCGDNLVVQGVLDKGAERRLGRLHYASRAIGRTMLGKYPSIEVAFQKTRRGEDRIVPFHRDWAVANHDDELCLVFRGEVVGYVLDESIKLLPERFYLKESLEVALV